MYVFFYIFHFSNNKAVIFMKYFFINMTAFSVLLSCFYFTNNLYLKFIHRLLQCPDAVQNLFP